MDRPSATAALSGRDAARARAAVAAAFFVNGLAFASWVSRIPALREDLQLDTGTLGSVLFALSVGVLSSFPLAGKGAQWLGARPVTLLSGVLLLQLHAKHRKSTWPLVGLVLLVPLIIAIVFIH